MKKIFSNKNWSVVFLGVILLLAALLRFWNIPDRYTFDFDATSDAIVAYVSARDLQLPLTGNFSSAGAFTFGPWYYYHLILFQGMTGIEYGAWLVNGILSVLTVLVMFFVGKKIKDSRLGLLLALLTAISPAHIVIGTMSSNPNLVALYASLAFLAFVHIIQENKNIWWQFLFGVFLGIAINAHYQALNLLVFPLFILFFAPNRRVTSFLASLLGLFVTFIPLILFNLIHNWHTVRNFVEYSIHGRGSVFVPNSWTIYIRDFWPEIFVGILGIPYLSVFILVGALIIFYTWLAYKRIIPKVLVLSLVFMAFTFLYMRYYWGERHFVYYYYLYPMLFSLIGYFLYYFSIIKRWYITVFLTVLLVITALAYGKTLYASQNYGYIKGQAENILQKYPKEKVSLYVCGRDDKTRASAIAYLLDREGRVGYQEKIKLAFPGKYCMFPSHESFPVGVATPSARILHAAYPVISEFDGFDFTAASESALIEAGWETVTVEKIYESEVRWWLYEKP